MKSASPAVKAGAIAQVCGLSPMQEGLLLHQQQSPSDCSYVMQSRYRIEGPFDPALLRLALRELSERQPLLRAAFAWSGLAEPKMVIFREVRLCVELAAAQEQAQIEQLYERERRRPFDLRRPPLMRWLVIRQGEERFILCKTYHHLITDGLSSATLMRELVALYRFHSGAAPRPELGPAPAGFDHYLKWLKSQPRAPAIEYWRARLAPFDDGAALPESRTPRRVESCELGLAPELWGAIRRWCSAQACTPATLLQATMGLLEQIEHGRSQATLGVVSLLRPPEQVEGGHWMGPMIATLPLLLPRLEALADHEAWIAHLQACQAQAFGDRQFAYLPLAEIAACRPSEQRGAPLFSTLLVVENWARASTNRPAAKTFAERSDALRIEPMGIKDGSHYPLTVYAVLGEQATLRVHADADLLGSGFAQRWVAACVGALQRAIEPASSAASIRAAIRKAAQASRGAACNLSAGRGADPWEALERWRVETPQAVAVRMDDQAWSYAQLREYGARVAAYLAREDVGLEDRVGLIGPRGPWMNAAMLGIWARGAAMFWVGHQSPAKRAQAMLEDAQPALLIFGPELESCPAWAQGFKAAPFEQCRQAPVAQQAFSPVHPEQLAYLMWTSGSTGRPKGVAVSRGALGRFLHAMRELVPLERGETWLAITALGFDISLLERCFPLIVGACCEMVDELGARNGVHLAQKLSSGSIRVCQATPSSWDMILRAGLDAPSLFALSGGEAISEVLAQKLLRQVGALMNVYGPTEATIWASASRIGESQRRVDIGRALGCATLQVADSVGEPSLGPGELQIGGSALARGYWRSPRQTARSFIPDPKGQGARLYRSGDRSYQDLDGVFYCVGRQDRQVKIRGHRIDLLGVEAAMLQSELGIAQAAALLVIQPRGAEQLLVGAYTAAAPVDHERLRASVGARMPAAAVPSRWVHCLSFPENDRRKRDDRVLARLLAERLNEAPIEASSLEPQGALESLVTQLWQEILGQGTGPEDDFFAQGGHSLLAMRMSSRLEPILGRSVPVALLLQHPRRVEWVAQLRQRQGDSMGDRRPELTARSSTHERFLASPAQRRFWWLETRSELRGRYNLLVAVAIHRAPSERVWLQALDQLVALHPLLRTRLRRIDGELYCESVAGQASDAQRSWGWIPSPQGASLRELLATEAGYEFALEAEPAWRMRVLALPDGRQALVFCAHHALLDGRSFEIVLRDLAALVQQPNVARPRPEMDYGAYAVWMQALDACGELDRQASYWREQLPEQGPPSRLATSIPPVALATPVETRPKIELEPAFCQRWRQKNQREMLTPFMVLLAAMARWLVPLTGQAQVCIGSPHQGRVDRRLLEVVGPFVQTIPWSVDLRDDPPSKVLLQRVRSTVLAGHEALLAPLERCYDPEQGTPFVALLSVNQEEPSSEPSQIEYLERPFAGHKAALSIHAKIRKNAGVTLELSYDPGRFSSEFSAQLLARFEAELKALVDNRPPCEAPNSGVNASPPRARSLMHRFEEQLRRSPDAPALWVAGREQSYAQLWSKAECLALALAQRGVKAGDRIALDFPRDASGVVGQLGVMACGAAYVPLMPEWGPEYKRRVQQHAGCKGRLGQEGPDTTWVLGELMEQKSAPSRIDLRARWSAELYVALVYRLHEGGPRGVAIQHRSLDSSLWDLSESLRVQPQERWSAVHTGSEYAALTEMWGAWSRGGCVCLFPASVRHEPEALLQALQRARVSVLSQRPSAFRALAEVGLVPDSLYYLLLSGPELRSSEVLAQWERWRGEADAQAFYLSTTPELGSLLSVLELSRCAQQSRGPGLAGVTLRVAAANHRSVVPGAVGELRVAGGSIAAEFWGDPRRSACRFMPAPHGAGGAREYRSGVRGYVDHEGGPHTLGSTNESSQRRRKRGQGEMLAACLLRQVGVTQVEILIQPETESQKQGLIAFYCSSRSLDPHVLRRQIEAELPAQQWPRALLELVQMPLTPEGNLDVDALVKKWEASQNTEQARSRGAERGIEQLVCRVYCEMLGRRVGVDDDFFELGGHSIMAVDLAIALSKALGQEISVATIFAQRTPAGIARACSSPQTRGKARIVALSGVARQDWVLCVHAGGGHVEGYRPLVAQLEGSGRQFWGLSCPSLEDPQYRAASIESMADGYLDQLRALCAQHQPRSLYLVGWSSGAVVAGAIAARWRAQEPELQGVVMLDPSRCNQAPDPQAQPIRPGSEGLLDVLGLTSRDPRWAELSAKRRQHIAQEWTAALRADAPWDWLAQEVNRSKLLPTELSAEFWRWRYERLRLSDALVRAYRPEHFTCPLHLWSCKGRGGGLDDLETLSPRMARHEYEGSHVEIVSDPTIAAALHSIFVVHQGP